MSARLPRLEKMLLVFESVHYSSDEVLLRSLVSILLITRKLELMGCCRENSISDHRNDTRAATHKSPLYPTTLHTVKNVTFNVEQVVEICS